MGLRALGFVFRAKERTAHGPNPPAGLFGRGGSEDLSLGLQGLGVRAEGFRVRSLYIIRSMRRVRAHG